MADALAYLLCFESPAEVAVPSWAQLQALAGAVDLGPYDATGKSVAHALADVAARGGLCVRATAKGCGLVIYRPGQDRARNIRMQLAGSVHAGETNVSAMRVSLPAWRSPQRVLAIGEAKRYEATLTLWPGWDPSLATTRWRDSSLIWADDWPGRADVYRKWVLNEHGWFSDEPWNLPTFDFASLGDDFFLRVPRRLGPCLSCDGGGKSLGIVVQYRTDPAGTWRRFSGPVQVSSRHCAIYLGGDNLPGDYFRAAAAGTVDVRVTGTVHADAHLTATAGDDASRGVKVLDCSRRGHWHKVHESSLFFGRTAAAERDDTDMLTQIAQCAAAESASGIDGTFTLAWIDAGYAPGDSIAEITGRLVSLTGPAGAACVNEVRHDYQRQQTTLTVRG